MIFLMAFSFLGAICLGFATFYRFKNNFTELEKAFEDGKIQSKESIRESFRKSINSEVVSSVFNNDVSNLNNEDINDFNSDYLEDNDEEELDSVYSYKTESSKYSEMTNVI
jgi:hypothetical protein